MPLRGNTAAWPPCFLLRDRPGPEAVGSTYTWTSVLADYPTWADLLADNATWADLLERVGSASDVIVP